MKAEPGEDASPVSEVSAPGGKAPAPRGAKAEPQEEVMSPLSEVGGLGMEKSLLQKRKTI